MSAPQTCWPPLSFGEKRSGSVYIIFYKTGSSDFFWTTNLVPRAFGQIASVFIIIVALFVSSQGSLQNFKFVFDKDITELMNNKSCPTGSSPVLQSDEDQQHFAAGKLF